MQRGLHQGARVVMLAGHPRGTGRAELGVDSGIGNHQAALCAGENVAAAGATNITSGSKLYAAVGVRAAIHPERYRCRGAVSGWHRWAQGWLRKDRRTVWRDKDSDRYCRY